MGLDELCPPMRPERTRLSRATVARCHNLSLFCCTPWHTADSHTDVRSCVGTCSAAWAAGQCLVACGPKQGTHRADCRCCTECSRRRRVTLRSTCRSEKK